MAEVEVEEETAGAQAAAAPTDGTTLAVGAATRVTRPSTSTATAAVPAQTTEIEEATRGARCEAYDI